MKRYIIGYNKYTTINVEGNYTQHIKFQTWPVTVPNTILKSKIDKKMCQINTSHIQIIKYQFNLIEHHKLYYRRTYWNPHGGNQGLKGLFKSIQRRFPYPGILMPTVIIKIYSPK